MGKFALFKHSGGYESMQLTRQKRVLNLYRNWFRLRYSYVPEEETRQEAANG